MQIESRRGLDALDEIARVEGVDGVFIGPSDLAASLGHLGQPGHEEVRRAIDLALAKLRDARMPAGILMSDAALADRCLEQGFRFVAVGTDVGLLVRASTDLAQRFRGSDFARPDLY